MPTAPIEYGAPTMTQPATVRPTAALTHSGVMQTIAADKAAQARIDARLKVLRAQ